jgi:hypothetical protein
MPPDDRIGSTTAAARLPADCCSIVAKPWSSSVRQSWEPSGCRNGDRRASGAGRVRPPGTGGPYPRRPAAKVSAAAPEVMPCHERSSATISYRPVYSLAILIAASFASAPVLSSSIRPRDAGSVAASRVARSTDGLLSMPE